MNKESSFGLPSMRGGVRQICGNCSHHRADPLIGWICGCDTSEYYTSETEYEHSCTEFSERSSRKLRLKR